MVWDDNNGIPGNVIYTKEEVMVEQGQAINGFYSYHIPGGVTVNGSFLCGWKQRSETFLNAGFDINTPHKGQAVILAERRMDRFTGGWKHNDKTCSR